ncbi:MAG: 50S ribosomal protein L10 [bacterium]|nr:50S ribosomal protein L10 [bacterium]
MPKTRVQKQEMIAGVERRLDAMHGVVFANFSGCTVHQLEELRAAARKENCEYLVVKKTLFNRAVAAKEIPPEAVATDGALSVLFGFADALAPAKIAKAFVKANERFQVLGGLMRDRATILALSAAEVRQLGDLPSREELIARAVGSIAAPLRGLVGVLSGNHRQFVQVLNAIRESKA